MNKDDVVGLFSEIDLSPGERSYLQGQSERLAYLADVVQGYVDPLDHPAAVLDVGPHFLTRTLIESLKPKPKVWTLGYAFDSLVPPHLIEQHHTIDLNEIAQLERPFDGQQFDVIVICEVVEHLFIPPHVVLSALRPLLKSPGGVLIVGTPNAVSISKRMRMLLGENPFHELSEDWRNFASHIREYTMRELRTYGERSGLRVIGEEYADYWGAQQFPGMDIMSERERNFVEYRDGLTVVYSV